MLNKVILIGRIANDFEIKKTNAGVPYTFFTLAVQRQGQKDQADFISCTAWRATAELMTKYVVKGSLISVEGSLSVFRTENNGDYNTRVSVNVSNVNFLDRRTTSDEAKKTAHGHTSNVDLSFDNSKQESDNTEIDFDSIKF